MKVLVLGCGRQGKAAVHELCRSHLWQQIICADSDENALGEFVRHLDLNRIRQVKIDVEQHAALVELLKTADVVIDMLPVKYLNQVAEAAIEAGTHLVNSMYGHQIRPDLAQRAWAEGITLLPEAGLDPGIDLILCGYAVSRLDQVHELHSWTGGFPSPEAAVNPLKYKITWTWPGVLISYDRDARIMEDGRIIEIPARDEFSQENIVTFDFPGVGRLEAFPNGDAIAFCEYLGITQSIRSTSRRALRWHGHSGLWKSMIDLGFLSQEPVPGLNGITPRQFMERHLEPRLQYRREEKDLVVMRNVIKGLKDGRKVAFYYDMVDSRDLRTGLFAMNRTVGYTAGIAARMIAAGKISRRGLLTAIRDVPYQDMIDELKSRGFAIKERIVS